MLVDCVCLGDECCASAAGQWRGTVPFYDSGFQLTKTCDKAAAE